jgi:hypothetical protein
MLIDPHNVDEVDFVILLFLLNSEGRQNYTDSDDTNPSVGTIIHKLSLFDVDLARLERLMDLDLTVPGPHHDDLYLETTLSISHLGLAFLINFAPTYLDRIAKMYGEVPDNLTATLVPLLGDLRRVPAADRFVSRADNQQAFKTLEESLEQIRLEILKDQNKNELPLKDKRALLAELEGMSAQLRGGFVRISDLTARMRPMLKNIADVCKDITVIALAVGSAITAIETILKALF